MTLVQSSRVFVLLSSLCVILLAAPGLAPAQEQETVGVPWTGDPGITETVDDIMARERLAPKIFSGRARPTKNEIELRELLPTRKAPPGSAVPRWPAPGRALAAPRPFNPQAVGTSFLGIQLSESELIPPDSMGDVGPTQILVATNGRIKVFDKNGVLGGLDADMDIFFNSVRNGSFTSDPHVRYDRLSGRWFITIINVPVDGLGNALGPNRVLIAVSSGPTITGSGSFTFFQFRQDLVGPMPNSDTNGFADYDTLGVDKLALYIGVNMFSQTADDFLGTTGFVVNKTNLIAGTLTVTAFRQMAPDDDSPSVCSPTTGPLTPQGVDNDDPAATQGYFIGTDMCLFNTLQIRRVSNPGGTPTLSGNLTLTVPSTRYPIQQVQPSGGPNLDAIDDRLFAAAIHKNKITGTSTLWTAHNIEVNSSGVGTVGGGRNGSRWYEIGSLTTTPALIQAGTLFDSAGSNPLGFWMPSVAGSGQGHMVIGTSRAGASAGNGHAGVAVAGRFRTDSLGVTQTPTLAQSSSFVYDVQAAPLQRWGDYSQVGVDPTDDMTMWTFQEYANATNSWGVRAIKLIAPPPATPASAGGNVPSGASSFNVAITGTSSAGSEFFDPGPDTGGPGFANRIAASVTGGVTVNSVTFNSPTQVTLNVSTIGAAPGPRDVTITNPDGQSRTGTGILTIVPGITINDVAVTEGNAGSTTATFTVTLSHAVGSTVTVNYATANGTATTADGDYVAASGVLTFTPGQLSKPIDVTVNGDTKFEANQTFFVNLSNPVNIVIADGQGKGTINNDDPPPVMSIGDAIVTEGNGGSVMAVFTVSLSGTSDANATVNYATANGSATAPADYVATSGTLTILAGATTGTIAVTVEGDMLAEPDETFFVDLASPTNAVLFDARGQGTIVNDDGRRSLCRPIVSLPYTITLQGNYCLVQNLSTAVTTGNAVTINSDFVSLDLKGFKIGGGGAGAGTQANGVYALNRKNITVKNGNIRGFFRAVFLEDDSGTLTASQGHLVSGVRADENTFAGIHVQGRGNVVRNNQVVTTGGTTVFGANADAHGIRTDGAETRILNNDVTDTNPSGTGAGLAITVDEATGSVVERNRLANSAASNSFGVKAVSGDDVLIVGNRISGTAFGVFYDTATGKFRDNLATGVATPYTGGTDAGNNQ